MELKITRPTLLLDENKMLANLQRMLEKAERTGTELIPHFKTHQSKEIGELIKEKGVKKITVSSMKMAEYFAQNGWNDITVAFPFNPLEIDVANQLVEQGIALTILVSDPAVVSILASRFSGKVNVLVEVDAGYNRSGIDSAETDLIKSLLTELKEDAYMGFYGLYCHPGNTYQTDNIEEIRQIWAAANKKVNGLKNAILPLAPDLKVRMGDTPGCTVVEDMEGVDEIGPGNFIFYDLVMNYLNVCDESDIAVAVACPVVAKYEERNQIIVHGGAVHFSKDHLFDDQERKFFGELVILAEDGWSQIIPEAKLTSLSQEHGVLTVNQETFNTIQIGDVLGFLPIHSCLTANLLKSYLTLDGKVYEHLENF
ncbi:MAG: alanine racemase [Roseivirga sp.]|uniref:alanine racemase n=1 Tax=Roseivirga sp. TaxID=1964215 RepID=UPI001B0F0418|nr:alanine racemase [Roseivirga sp.]MBO6495204.1 alanine racemase [Roseivirga sp.]